MSTSPTSADAAIDGFPVPVAGRKITPGSTNAGPPQHAVDDQPAINPPAATPGVRSGSNGSSCAHSPSVRS